MIEPLVCVPSATGASFAATAAADPLDEPPGVCASVMWILGRPRDEERILRGDGLADDDCAGGAQSVHDDGVPLGPASSEMFSAEFGRHVARVDDVLDGDGQAMERSWRYARRSRLVDAFGRCKRGVRIEIGEGAELGVKGCDAIEKRAHRLDRGEFAATHAVDQRTCGLVRNRVVHLCALRGRRPDEQAREQPLDRPVACRGVENEQNRDQEHPVQQSELLRVNDDVAEPGLRAEIFCGENRAPAGAKAKSTTERMAGRIAGRTTVR